MRLAAVLFALAAATTALLAADFAPERVVRLVEAEKFGLVSGLREVTRADAAGGQAVALSEDSQVLAMLALPAGDYTFVLRLFAPAGDQDGFFVEINGVRTRRTAPIGRWSNLAFPFRAGGAEPVVLSLIGQEPGLLADRLAVVKGTVTDDAVDLRTLAADPDWPAPPPGATGRMKLMARLREPGVAVTATLPALFRESFDSPPAGVSGSFAPTAGRVGAAIALGAPDGHYAVATSDLPWGPKGTVEWWVRPRPAQRLWHDQGWHYFFYALPGEREGLRLELSRHPATMLQLTASAGAVKETVAVDTGRAKLEDWHHLLVSWDLTGDTQYLWLLFDGVGRCSSFPRSLPSAHFQTLGFANRPPDLGLPYLPMDGALDEVRVTAESVRERLQ